MKKAVLMLTTLFVFLFLTVNISLADSNTINGCVSKKDGSLRVVSATTPCKSNETSITWNIKGDTGATGATGSQGTAGANGHSPIVSMSGDQITVDGAITGPHLTGPQGPAGTGSGVDGMSRVVMGNVWADGTIGDGTGNFQVIKDTNAPGVYHIQFATQFIGDPICVCAIQGYILEGQELATCRMPFDPMYGFLSRDVVLVINGYTNPLPTVDGAFTFICATP